MIKSEVAPVEIPLSTRVMDALNAHQSELEIVVAGSYADKPVTNWTLPFYDGKVNTQANSIFLAPSNTSRSPSHSPGKDIQDTTRRLDRFLKSTDLLQEASYNVVPNEQDHPKIVDLERIGLRTKFGLVEDITKVYVCPDSEFASLALTVGREVIAKKITVSDGMICMNGQSELFDILYRNIDLSKIDRLKRLLQRALPRYSQQETK